jgi:phage repressor protein C with HTH and peptisase S24 domain
MDKKERLIKAYDYLREKGLAHTQKDIAEKMKSTQQNVSSALNGKESVLTNNFLARFNNAYDNIFSLGWLLKGEGEMLNGNPVAKPEGEHYTFLLPQSAIGGSLVDFGADGVLPDNCERIVSPIADVDFAITIYGDSMTPEYPQGSTILIKEINPDAFIVWGNVYVLDTCNGVIVKELQPSEKEGTITCHSQNPNGRYKDFEVSLADVRGIYRVLACVTAK